MKFEVEIENQDVLKYIEDLANWHKISQSEAINLVLEDMVSEPEIKILPVDTEEEKKGN
jgi:hypothetical protein